MANGDEIIKKYYSAFNSHDWQGMLSLLSPEVQHDLNEGESEIGTEAFTRFLQVMDEHYDEKVEDLVIFSSSGGSRFAAEFFIDGRYKKSQPGLPKASGQPYHLRVGAFFELNGGKISRITNYYNLKHWIELVSK